MPRAFTFPESDSVGEFFTADIAYEHAVLVVWRRAVVLENKVGTDFTLLFLLQDKGFLSHCLDSTVSAESHLGFVVTAGNALAHPVGFSHGLLFLAFLASDFLIFFVPSRLGSVVKDHFAATLASNPVFVLGGESLSIVLGNLLDNVLFPLLFKSEHFLVSELVHILFVVLADTHLL